MSYALACRTANCLRNIAWKWNAAGNTYRAIQDESGPYQGDGKTTVTVLNEEDDKFLVNAYSSYGFRLSNGMFIIGPIALFPRSVFQWNIRDPGDISPESLALFTTLAPKLDILVIGYGERGFRMPDEVARHLLRHRINMEVLPTSEACSTFNFLNSEYRYVAAALVPPLHTAPLENELPLKRILEKRFLIED